MTHGYTATVRWQRRAGEAFSDKRYSRRHEIAFDGGVVLPASSSPLSVPLPYSDASAVDPEEMFVAAIASCHMLWFLSLAAAEGWRIERYVDEACGTMAPNEAGRPAMVSVTLRPQATFCDGRAPDREALDVLHQRAHAACYIANSVKTVVSVAPRR